MYKERNYGIDLLRIVSMLMVVGIHCIGQTGLREVAEGVPLQNQISWLFSALCYGAVDLYALITGYVCIDGKHRWGRIVELWMQVFFYSAGICVTWFVLSREISAKEWVLSFLPAFSNHYWYFSSYILLFVAMPFLIKMLNSLKKQQYQGLLILCFFVICGFGWLSEGTDFVPFRLSYGYSPVWLIILFIIGGYLKRYEKDFAARNKYIYLAGWAACVLLTWLSKIVITALTNGVLHRTMFDKLFYSYLSPTVVLSAVFLFLFFGQLKVSCGKRLIAELSSVTFGVYLIHSHCLVNRDFIHDRFIKFSGDSWLLLWIEVFLLFVAIYVLGSAIDYVRKQLFRLLHVPQFCQKLTDWVYNLVFCRIGNKK